MLARLLALWRGRFTARAARSPVFCTGSVIPDDGPHICVAVKSLSAEGARIAYWRKERLPEEFTLVEPIRNLRRRARVVWQEEFTAGLMFVNR